MAFESRLLDAAGNAFLTDITQQAQSLAAPAATNNMTLRGQAMVSVQVTGTWTGTLQFEGSTDGSNYNALNAFPLTGGAPVTSTTANGHWFVVVSSLNKFQVRASALSAGAAIVSVNAAQGTNEQSVISGTALGSTTAGQLSQLVSGAVTTAAPAYTTAQNNALSLTTAGGLRNDLASQAGTAITSVPVAAGTGTLTGNAPVVNAAVYGGASPAGGAAGAAVPAGIIAVGARVATANPTNLANNQAVDFQADKAGRLVTTMVNHRENIGKQATTISAVTTETTIVAAGGANVFRDLIALVVSTNNAAASTLTIREATAGATVMVLDLPPGAAATPPICLSFPVPIPQAAANNNWTAQASVNAGAVRITALFANNL